MESRIKDRISGLFTARAEKVFYTAVAVYTAVFIIVQVARFIIQNI